MKRVLTEEQKEKQRARQRKYALKNKEKVIAASALWNKSNKDKTREAAKRHYDKRKTDPAYMEMQAKKTKKWNSENPDKVRLQSARKRAAKLNRTPSWLTVEHEEKIAEFYKVAQCLSNSFGEPFHVDHIVPLRGKLVSGLHVPWNLTILTGKQNMQKSNSFCGFSDISQG